MSGLENIIKEYDNLRNEINKIKELENFLLMFMIVIVVAVLAFALKCNKTFLFLLPFSIILPISMRISYYRISVIKLSAYIIVYIEGIVEELNWETKNVLLTNDNQGGLYDSITISRNYEGMILSVVCYILYFWDFIKDKVINIDTVIFLVTPLLLVFWEGVITKRIVTSNDEKIDWIDIWKEFKDNNKQNSTFDSIMSKKDMKRCFRKKFKHKMAKCIKNIYSIISVMATLTVFSALLLFLLGRSNLGKVCDDDLIMQRIKNQVPSNLQISDIKMEDIHGFGNESIIVLAVDYKDSEIANQLLIFDKIDNAILNQFNNILGFGSNYKLSYSFSMEGLYDESIADNRYDLKIIDLIDMTGDFSKELVVDIMSYHPGSGLYSMIGIFSYSYKKHAYYLLGTYPKSELYDTDKFFNPVSTDFRKGNPTYRNVYDKNETFNLEYSSKYQYDFFVESWLFGIILVRTRKVLEQVDDPDTWYYILNVFKPLYDSTEDELEWEVLISEKFIEKETFFSEKRIKKYLKENHVLSLK
ncbi:MAG: hypothetical protein HFH73_09370 [Lachnospiraceae bacterium]|jgi:hypothetical protein|nr:hypothetical protein [Lachnospiraceae bacterium]